MAATLCFIGHIKTPYATPEDCPKQPNTKDGPSHIIVDDEYAIALKKLKIGDWIQVLYWLDQSDRSTLKTIPKGIDTNEEYGVFATRSPNRPNPIAISTTEITAITDNTITVNALDCVSGTPLLDIKPYVDQLQRLKTD